MSRPGSAVTLLRDRPFRRLWTAVITSFLGYFVNIVACAWVMTGLTDSATMVALVQTAAALPTVIFSILSGGFADVFDRRRVMLVAQVGMFSTAAVLMAMSAFGLHSPISLLLLTFLVGTGSTILVPAWQVSLGDITTRDKLPEAVSLHMIGANLMKLVGPFLGGLVLATLGATMTFVISTLSYIPAMIALSRWKPPRRSGGGAKLAQAIGEGVRYLRAARQLHPIVERVFLFGLCANGIHALLPLVARDQLGGGAHVYGLLFGGFGLGAILGGLSMSWLRRALGMERTVTAGVAANALAILMLSQAPSPVVGFAATMLAGIAWLVVLTLLNSTLQLAAPRRLVGRMIAMHLTFCYLGLAIGGWLWGAVADLTSPAGSLVINAAGMAAIVVYSWWRRLPDITGPEPDPVPAGDV